VSTDGQSSVSLLIAFALRRSTLSGYRRRLPVATLAPIGVRLSARTVRQLMETFRQFMAPYEGYATAFMCISTFIAFIYLLYVYTAPARRREWEAQERRKQQIKEDWARIKSNSTRTTEDSPKGPTILESLVGAFTAYHNSSPEEKNQLKQELGDSFPFSRTYLNSKTNHIVVVGSIIVTYEFAGLKFISASKEDIARIDGRIREVIIANSTADLRRLEAPLGIKIVDIQGQINSTSTPHNEQSREPDDTSGTQKSKGLKDVIL
jgi:hypothetical protein